MYLNIVFINAKVHRSKKGVLMGCAFPTGYGMVKIFLIYMTKKS